MSAGSFDVAVAGAGIVGLTAAALFANAGARVVLVAPPFDAAPPSGGSPSRGSRAPWKSLNPMMRIFAGSDSAGCGVAVGSERGLVVPILRNVERMSFAEVERKIRDYGERARDGKLTLDELTGGTFTISNGGVFGSLVSTPILNPPQSAILGMHKIQERPVAENGEVVIRPMMYLALSYDHRIIDGREAVQFLDTVRKTVEDPTRMLLQI